MESYSAKPKLDHFDFTVAWLCVLPLEIAIAIALLDEQYPGLLQGSNDNNTYALGRIGRHNVVVTGLNGGLPSPVSPARSVSSLIRSYPSIRSILSIGLGGGAPNQDNDIRLGDVVVGVPSGPHDGVIELDRGRLSSNSTDVARTKHLIRPPGLLLNGAMRLKAGMMEQDVNLRTLFQETFSKHPELVPHMDLATLETDLLSEPHHQSRDTSKIVQRSIRDSGEPKVHHGTIVSGDFVVRDALLRDRLSDEYGAICFEMEGAGICQTASALLIRGICDYADSHKNKNWQPYAAAMASIYAKMLLLSVTEENVTQLNLHSSRIPRELRAQPFIGQEACLDKLKSILLDQSCRIAALTGLGGVGKTSIAVEFAHQASEFFAAVFWVSASNQDAYERGFREIATLLGFQDDGAEGIQIMELVKERLSRQDMDKWLLVIDNIDTDLAIKAPGTTLIQSWRNFLPQSTSGSILLTTRNVTIAATLAGHCVINVGTLMHSEALELLSITSMIPKNANTYPKLRDLVQILDGSPLAITMAATHLRERSQSIVDSSKNMEDYMKDYKRTLFSLRRGSSGQINILSMLNNAIDSIRAQDSFAADILFSMSFLSPRKVPLPLLPIIRYPERIAKAIDLLVAWSWMETAADGNTYNESRPDTVYLSLKHQIMYDAVYDWLKTHNQLELCAGNVIEHLGAIAGENEEDMDWNDLFPHLRHVLSNILSNLPTQQHRSAIFQTLNAYLNCCTKISKLDEATVFLNELLDAAKREDEGLAAQIMFFLASAYSQQNEFEHAGRILEQALRLGSSDSMIVIEGGSALASVRVNQGLFEEATTLLFRALEESSQVSGESSITTLRIMMDLATAKKRAGLVREAKNLDERALALSKESLGESHPLTAMILGGCAETLRLLGMWQDAEHLERQTLELCKDIFGPEHENTLSSMSSLAMILVGQARYAEAEKLGEELLELTEMTFGPENESTLSSMSNLALTYLRQGRLTQAEQLQEVVLNRRVRLLGDEHPDTLQTSNHLASIYCNQGKLNAAEQLQLRTLESAERALGKEHPTTFTILNNLAQTYRLLGDHEKAIHMATRALKLSEEMLGTQHPSTLVSMANLGLAYSQAGRLEEAIDLLEKVVEWRTKVLGSEHPDTHLSMENLKSLEAKTKLSASMQQLDL